MDDAFQQQPKTPIEERWHQKQHMQVFDIIRIANPTNKDFYIRYDTNQYQRVPANGTLDVPRFKARWYIKHMKDQIINDMIQEKHDAEIAQREKEGKPGFDSKWAENQATYVTARYPKTDDEKLIAEIMDKLWIGLVLENRSDPPPNSAPSTQIDLQSKESKILEQFEGRRVTDAVRTVVNSEPPIVASTPPPMTTPSPFAAMNSKLNADDVTVD